MARRLDILILQLTATASFEHETITYAVFLTFSCSHYLPFPVLQHLNTEMNSSTDYSEMICETCVRRNPFLLRYVDLHGRQINP